MSEGDDDRLKKQCVLRQICLDPLSGSDLSWRDEVCFEAVDIQRPEIDEERR